MHKSVYIDSQTGYLADESTSYLSKRKIALLDLIRNNKYNSIEINDKRYTIQSRFKPKEESWFLYILNVKKHPETHEIIGNSESKKV